MKKIILPAQLWDNYANTINCLALSQQKGQEVVSIKAFEHNGYLHMVYAAMHCIYSTDHASTLYAYRLLPEDLMEGETTVWHDEKAIEAGLRERGDHSGLIVSVNRERMVCAFPVHFIKGIPSIDCRLPASKAVAHDKSNQGLGWRSAFKGLEPSWLSLDGHPVARYSNNETEIHVIFWQHDGSIEEMAVAPTCNFVELQDCQLAAKPVEQPQMALF